MFGRTPSAEPDTSALALDDTSSLQELERAGVLGIDAPALVATLGDDVPGLIALHEIGRGLEAMALGLLNRPNVKKRATLTAVEGFEDLGARLANAVADRLAAIAEERCDMLDDGDLSDLAPIILPRAMSRHASRYGGPAALALVSRLVSRFADLAAPSSAR
ncbi:hypothetical protein [Salinarimonas chemoclinalis]|uniref:hypothetical protein n=1 Tax=Salinarimonas chemoclinalis TaxID=3241599 RepID=UPI0035589F27